MSILSWLNLEPALLFVRAIIFQESDFKLLDLVCREMDSFT